MFDLDDLSLPTPRARPRHDWMCVGCRRVSAVVGSCTACGGKEYVAHVDRRPLMLSKETRNGIVDLIDKAGDRVPEAEIDEQLQITGEYMPFLSKLLDDAELADKRHHDGGSGYRTTSLSTEELLSLFHEMKLPTS